MAELALLVLTLFRGNPLLLREERLAGSSRGLFLGARFGGEPPGAADWAGGGLIVLGVLAGEVGGALERRTRAGEPAAAPRSAEFPESPAVP